MSRCVGISAARRDSSSCLLYTSLVRDRGTLYTVMEAKAGKMELSLSQVWGGVGLAHDPLADRYIVEKIVRTQMALAHPDISSSHCTVMTPHDLCLASSVSGAACLFRRLCDYENSCRLIGCFAYILISADAPILR